MFINELNANNNAHLNKKIRILIILINCIKYNIIINL